MDLVTKGTVFFQPQLQTEGLLNVLQPLEQKNSPYLARYKAVICILIKHLDTWYCLLDYTLRSPQLLEIMQVNQRSNMLHG